MRKFLKILLIVFLSLIFVAVLVPVLFKGKIIGLVKQQINNQIHGQLEFDRSGLSLLRSFPNLTLSFYDLKLSGADSFARVDLFKCKSCRVTVDLMRLIKYRQKGIQLNKINLDQPFLNLLTLPSGLSNLEDIYKPKDTHSVQEAETSDLRFLLTGIRITDGAMNYLDQAGELGFSFNHLDHRSSGEYSGSLLTLQHKNTFDSLTYKTGSLELLSNLKGSWNGLLSANLDSSIYHLADDQLQLNEFKVQLNLMVQLLEARTRIDLQFETPQNDLKQLVSLIPGAYQSQFDKITTSGEFSLKGKVNGEYAESGRRPLFTVQAKVNQGEIKYAHLPYPVQNIQFDLEAKSLDTLMNDLDIHLSQLSLNILQDKIEGNLFVNRRGELNKIKGHNLAHLNLENITKAFPLDGTQLQGKLNLDVTYEFDDRDVINKQYDRLKLAGEAMGAGLEITYSPYPTFKAESIHAQMDPKQIQLDLINCTYGKSDLAGALTLNHPLAWFTKYPSLMSIQAKTTSRLLNLDELSNTGTTSCDTCIQIATKPPFIPSISFQSAATRVIYSDYDLKDLTINGSYSRDTLKIQSFQGNINHSDLSIHGRLDHPYNWSANEGTLTGWLNIKSKHFLVDPWMAQETSSTGGVPDTSYQKKLPPRTELIIYPDIDQLTYDQYHLKNIKGTLGINQQSLEIHEGSANLFNGKINLDGLYNEAGALPLFNFKLDLSRLGFDEMFKTSPTFAKLAPIAEFIEGVFSSSLVMSGRLNKDQMPVWQDLSAAGLIETVTGLLSKFKPLERASKYIQLPILDLIKWEKSRNWFEIVNGSVVVKPFTIQYQNIPITVSGTHRLDQNMDYDILWQIPRALFDQYKIGLKTNEALNWLRNEVKNKGLDVGTLDTVFINMNLTGSIKNPVVQFKWLLDPALSLQETLQKQVIASLEQKADSLKKEATEKIEDIKDSVVADINQKIDEQKQKLDSLKQSTLDTLSAVASTRAQQILDSITRNKVGSILDSAARSKLDTILGKKSKEEIDKINDKLKNWNPFKKKPAEPEPIKQ